MARPVSRVSGVVTTGPLAPFTAAYTLKLRERRYTPLTMVNQQRQVARLSRWLADNGLTAAELTGERVEEFLAVQRAEGRHRSQWSRPALLCLLDTLRELGEVPAEDPASAGSVTDALLACFERYLLSERGLAVGTARLYVLQAGRFLSEVSACDLAGVTAGEVVAAVLRVSAAVSVSATQNFVSGLRAFLRFCFVTGRMDFDLSQAALPVTGRRRSALPRGIGRADARALVESSDRRSTIGRRDYAIIILLLRLGLRAGELAALRLEDIDWRAGVLVVRGKRARRDCLPLPSDVGQAIVSYLKRRPVSQRREVFLRARAPFGPIAAETVSSVVRRACHRAAIPELGAHRLRHTVACQMLAAQVPLVQIAQVLRHDSLQSTAIYARVDLDQLRQLAAPWPEGAPR
jgi:integrase/recombinase XerD